MQGHSDRWVVGAIAPQLLSHVKFVPLHLQNQVVFEELRAT